MVGLRGGLQCVFHYIFLAHHSCPSNCHRISNKATDPISIALSSSQYAKDYL